MILLPNKYLYIIYRKRVFQSSDLCSHKRPKGILTAKNVTEYRNVNYYNCFRDMRGSWKKFIVDFVSVFHNINKL